MQIALALLLLAGSAIQGSSAANRVQGSAVTLHYAPNHNFNASGTWRPAAAGFDLADIADPRELSKLPPGVRGLVWVGLCIGAEPKFITTIAPYVGREKVFGFYLMDDPDPRPGPARCRADSLRAEADWIHAHVPGALTFIVLMNLSTPATPSYRDTFNPDNSHIDLYGIDPYPCRSELNGCSLPMIEQYVAAATAAGIPRARIVPVYQAFGGGRWSDGAGGSFTLPTTTQLRTMLAEWRVLLPAPVFDYAYSWGSQRSDQALESSPELRAVFLEHNRAHTTAALAGTSSR